MIKLWADLGKFLWLSIVICHLSIVHSFPPQATPAMTLSGVLTQRVQKTHPLGRGNHVDG